MFEWDATSGGTRRRFWGLFVASVVVHVGLLAGSFGAFAYATAAKFGLFDLDWDESYANQVEVTTVSTAPLKYPSGFFAVKEPPKEIVRREEPERPRPEPKKEPAPDEPEKPATKDGTDATGSTEQADQPAPPAKFGTIRGNALKPHLKKIYAEYEAGNLPDGPFRVTVTCKVQPDGSLTDIKVTKSSGNEQIDTTAINLFRELSAMHALGKLSTLSSLSLTLDRGASSTTLSAVGFAKSYGEAEVLATELGFLKTGAQFLAKNPDEQALVQATSISQAGNRLSVSCSLPNSRAGEMMRKSYGSQPTAAVPAKPSA